LRPTEGEFSSPASGAMVELVFDAKNWNKKQTVTVVGVNDDVVDGDQTYDIEFGPSASMDGLYNGKMPAGFTLTNVDDDAP